MITKEDYNLISDFMKTNETYQKLFGAKDDFLFNTIHMIMFSEFIDFYHDRMENVPVQEES